MREKRLKISCNITLHIFFYMSLSNTFFRESEKQISYLEENYLKPLRDAEKKANRILLAFKDRKTLQKIHGIIETNSSYITSNNEIAGKTEIVEWKMFEIFHYL